MHHISIDICIFLGRFDDYSFYYDEYLDMEECWEESDQVWFQQQFECWYDNMSGVFVSE